MASLIQSENKFSKYFEIIYKFHLLLLNWSNILLDIKMKKNWRLILNFFDTKFISKTQNVDAISRIQAKIISQRVSIEKKKNIVKSLEENIDTSIFFLNFHIF